MNLKELRLAHEADVTRDLDPYDIVPVRQILDREAIAIRLLEECLPYVKSAAYLIINLPVGHSRAERQQAKALLHKLTGNDGRVDE